jgi:uncharacterized protein (UPF0332 family)
MKSEAGRYLDKARKAILLAEKLLRLEYPADACSKAYYAMFYAAQALLRENSIVVNKHSAVIAKLGERYVKTGKIDVKYHRFFIDAKQKRETADYDVFMTIDAETAEERITRAKEFLRKIESLLSSK